MSKNLKIYLKTGVGFLVIFVASVIIITLLQAKNNLKDMERSLVSTTELGENVIQNVKWHNDKENKYADEQLMWSVNSYIASFVSGAWSNHNIYSSVLLLDSKRQIVSRSGFILQYDPGMERSEYNRMISIPLEKFCSAEQITQLYKTFRSDINGQNVMVSGEISGFIDNLGQWIPRKLILYSNDNKSETLTLEYNIEPENDYQPASQTFQKASLYIPGPGTYQNIPTKADQKILKECDELAVRQIDTAQENQLGAGGMSKTFYMTFDGVGTINIDGETYYFAIGGQGFPLRAAISELGSFYIFFLIVMLILFFLVSHGFVRQYQQQILLESDRRKLTTDTSAKLKEPLDIIRDYITKLRQSASDEERAELLDNIINKTEQMDDAVKNLLTSAQSEKGKKDEKG